MSNNIQLSTQRYGIMLEISVPQSGHKKCPPCPILKFNSPTNNCDWFLKLSRKITEKKGLQDFRPGNSDFYIPNQN